MEENRTVKETTPASPGDVVTGVIEQVMPYGAFVRLSSGQRAMVHISQLSHNFVKDVADVVAVNQEITAKIIKIDEKGRIDLSIKAMSEAPSRPARPPFKRPGPAPVGAPRDTAPRTPEEDFEKKLSNFMKKSEERISTLNSGGKSSGRGGKKKGGR
ncbi:S1 RNA-binding domain-containing protein [Dethiosulfovibrio salsuginis]|uniref:S1 RNA binding domain protein n=1 Tax=Dethiosulfovibrio salsuginis TaxID=561720 RepID=A0A1X7JNP0_9BACT|nr:S1 RNA-binding domain-containing protein [Dethiosulfovibrio salsuginis]SMG29721.1 S1 RNA binding domain protein [Dethiosulfovibrio salsuginis]